MRDRATHEPGTEHSSSFRYREIPIVQNVGEYSKCELDSIRAEYDVLLLTANSIDKAQNTYRDDHMWHVSFVSDQLETLNSFLVTNNIFEHLRSVLLNPKKRPFTTAITTVNNSEPQLIHTHARVLNNEVLPWKFIRVDISFELCVEVGDLCCC